jgi:hypothetical protein
MKKIEVETIEEKVQKEQELQIKVDAYKAAQQYQLQYGGPGPVADYETMEIVNEYNGEFQVVVKQESKVLEEKVVDKQ